MTIPSFSKQSNVEERWGQTTTTTYERWRKRNRQKMDVWIRGSDPVERERHRQEELRVERYYQKKKKRIRQGFEKNTKTKRYI